MLALDQINALAPFQQQVKRGMARVERQWDKHDARQQAAELQNNRIGVTVEQLVFVPYPDSLLFGAYTSYAAALEGYIFALEKTCGIETNDHSLTVLKAQEAAAQTSDGG